MEGAQQDSTIPIVSRITDGRIIELVYDADKRATALAVSGKNQEWTLERQLTLATGETLVPYSPRNNLIAHNCVLFAARPEPSGSKQALLSDIRTFLHRYVDLSPTFEEIAAHYALLTWLYDAFAEVPYLRLRGDYGTGKTRALIAIGAVCNKGFFAAGASTVSPIFHTLDRFGGTLVLDEADFRFTDATADLVKIFNNGNVKGLPVLRAVQNRHKEFNPAAFNVFGPKIIAMRGAFEDEALESRFLTEETGMRPLRADIPLHVPDSLHREALELRNRLLHFRLSNFARTKPDPGRAGPDLDPRRNQIALPLLSLMDSPELRESVFDMLRADQTRTRRDRSMRVDAQVLAATLHLLAAKQGNVSIQSIADEMNRKVGREGQQAVAARRVGGIIRTTFHIDTRKAHGVFVVDFDDRAKLEAIAVRYGISLQSQNQH